MIGDIREGRRGQVAGGGKRKDVIVDGGGGICCEEGRGGREKRTKNWGRCTS
jgi:hypothetical protein